MSDNPWEDPEFRAWADHVDREVAPMMAKSAIAVTLYSGKHDVKLAVELGLAMLMDKPIIMAVFPGVQVPKKLVQVADHILETDPNNLGELADSIARIMGVTENERDDA